MKFTFHGAGQEVGRSCIELNYKGKQFIFDAGLKITPNSPLFPVTLGDLSKVTAVFISHIHLDHTGSIPLLYAKGLRCPIYTGTLTKALLPILLNDSWKVAMIENFTVGFKKSDIEKSINLIQTFKETPERTSEFQVPGATVKTFDAGHVPGARSIFVDFGDRNVLYSGDVNLVETPLIHKADIEHFPENVDTLILESTYGNENHPDREVSVKRFLDQVQTTLDHGGHVIIPSFSIGRSQEILMRLHERGLTKYPVFFDGMSKKIAAQFLKHPTLIKNCPLLRDALHHTRIVEKQKDREEAMRKQSIIITTAGMLDGGPVLYYLPKVAHDPRSAVLLTGYQAEKTNGQRLMKEKYIIADGEDVQVKCYVEKFDFSGHAGKDQLHEIINKVKPKHVILNHGDPAKIEAFKKYVEEHDFECHSPKTGDTFEV
jgi:putative mRNA 3-end processing factor